MESASVTTIFSKSPPTHAGESPHDAQARLGIAVDDSYWPRALALRVVIALSYFVLIPAGLLPMSNAWWLASGGSLLVYSIIAFAVYARWPKRTWVHSVICPYIDTVVVTVAMIALARPDYPLWIGYLLIISSLSAVQSTKYVLAFSVWSIAWFWLGVWVLDAGGLATLSWQVGAVVTIMLIFTAINSDVISTSNRRLQEMVLDASMTDPLTGLANRRRFGEILDLHATWEARPVAVLMFDIDNFKQLNETYGHVHADGVLIRICDAMRECLRDADVVARYGGDEFIVLAHVASIEAAAAMAQRNIDYVREQTGIAISAGVAVFPNDAATLDGAVTAADHAMGMAKRAGKARVMLAEQLPAA